MGGITKMAASVPVVPMDRGNNTTCTINLHGATIVSWRVNNQEQLFVSKKSVFDGRKPIRGGIPFIFPQFGTWHYGTNGPPYNGFGRIARWQCDKVPERLPSGDIEAIFSLCDSDYTFSMWQHQFRISYRIILREKELHLNIDELEYLTNWLDYYHVGRGGDLVGILKEFREQQESGIT